VTDTVIGSLGVLVTIGAIWAAVAVPDFIEALLARVRGRRRGCVDCGGNLDGSGTTCMTCRDIRRQRLAQGETRTPREGPDGDNGP
jgi:hypothetical protein